MAGIKPVAITPFQTHCARAVTVKHLIPLAALAVALPAAQAQIFSDDFSSGSVANVSYGYLGGWFSPQVAFKQWFGNSAEAEISGGGLTVQSTASSARGAFLVLAPGDFPGGGTYTLNYDISAYTQGNAANSATVRVWTGSGYDLTLATGNAWVLNPQTGVVSTEGSAVATLAASASITGTGPGSLSFTRGAGDAVAIFFGVTGAGWPFPSMTVDGMSVVPEPHEYAALAGLGLLGFAVWRRMRRA